jgi:hypothetical protein
MSERGARQAARVAVILPPEDREVLLAAAYLHDIIGYPPSLMETGLHGSQHSSSPTSLATLQRWRT